ncbi:acyl-lipid (8-3)-desaturase [Folsomia candida]|uniref:Delta(6)-fatty-acid desaturase fat-3 n=1 Tax=Folsomia candida TaxID=158441 RepID=A0A226ES57_FOLCA|nr:acyl-lipid (8-3)-desaturase [Folsomia candida]OXA59621.1 Delta(6)-fatty-acid desaturase fat-3 [Folsomia candida]
MCRSEKKEILHNGYFYDVTNFSHPGGNIISFFVNNGEDSTNTFRQFHHRSIAKSSLMLQSLPRRKAEPGEYATTIPPEQLERHRQLTAGFQKLFKELERDGFFEPSPTYICIRIVSLLLFIGVGFQLAFLDATVLRLLGLVMLAVGGAQSGWVMHEAGHYSLTGRPKLDRILQSLIFGLSTGFSAAWWRTYHNRHHAAAQRVGKDEDVNYLPLIAFNKETVPTEEEGKSFWVRNQALLYFPIDGFLIIFYWKMVKCPRYAWHKGAYLDLFCMGVHYATVAYSLGLLPYLFVIWMTAIYTLGHLSLNHTHTPVTEVETHWVEHALTHTVDIAPSWWVDLIMGYLNYHVLHHLFPTMPLFRGRKVMDRIKQFAQEYGLPYQCHSYWKSIQLTITNVRDVARELQQGI